MDYERRAEPAVRANALIGAAIFSRPSPLDTTFSFEESRLCADARGSSVTFGRRNMKTAVVPHVAKEKKGLAAEARRATSILRGKSVKKVWRHRASEIGIEFADGSRLFVDARESGLELSIT